MTGIASHLKEDVRKDPRALEQEADRARADVERDLQDLERRLSPNVLFDRTIRAMKENGGDFGRNLATQVRNNPVPTMLAGIGLAWLMAASDRPPRPRPRSSTEPSLGERMSSAAASTRSAAGHAAGSARGAAHTVAGAAHSVAGTARGAAHGVSDATHRLRDSYAQMTREQPLVLGALAVAAGAAIGALLPGTQTEDRLIGEASDEAAGRLRDQAQRTWEEAKETAADAAEAAEQAAASRSAQAREGAPGASSGEAETSQRRPV